MAAAKEKGQRLSVSLPPSRIEWLKGQPGGISGTLNALVTEAMAMSNLRASVAQLKKKK